MKDRIQRIMEDRSMSASKLADMLQVQPSGISHILSGRNKPSMDFMVKFLNVFPEVNPEWFVLGNGPIYKNAIPESETILKQPGTEMASIDYETVELKATGNDDGTIFSGLSCNDMDNTEKEGPCNAGNLPKYARVGENSTHIFSPENSQPLSASTTNKRITRVMVFYSDHTVEAFEYCDPMQLQ